MRHLVLAALAAASLAAAPVVASAAAQAAPAGAKAPSKMKTCASEWKGMNAADKGRYNDKAKTMKSKKGNTLNGYQAWTSECMKKKA